MAHKIDTENAVDTMPVAAAAGTPGWFTDADPLNPTHLDADWCNMVQGELANIVSAFGGSLVKGTVNQIATALVEYVLTNGRFSTSLIIRPHPTTINRSDFYFYGLDLADCGIYSRGNKWMVCPAGGSPGVILYPYFIDAGAGGIASSGDISTDTNLIVKGKVKNAAGADVVFDDGIDVEGAVTAQGGLKITHETTSAAWDTDHWEATLARRAASITIDFSAHNLASGGSVTLDIAAAGVSSYARCYGVFDNMGGPPPLITQFASAGSVSLTLWNVGVAAITASAVLCVDIIDKA